MRMQISFCAETGKLKFNKQNEYHLNLQVNFYWNKAMSINYVLSMTFFCPAVPERNSSVRICFLADPKLYIPQLQEFIAAPMNNLTQSRNLSGPLAGLLNTGGTFLSFLP